MNVPDETTPTWTEGHEALRVVVHGPHLRKTLRVAIMVGCLLFTINQLDVVLRGEANLATWIKGALTFFVPFGVSNYGILIATHRRK